MALRLLIVEGNIREDREAYRAGFGHDGERILRGDACASLRRRRGLRHLLSRRRRARTCPAPTGSRPTTACSITGSALNLYDGGPAIQRQIDLARAVFASRTPFFGSCWGLQVASAAAGGEVVKNPKGREIGVARNIWPTEAGRAHPLLAGRSAAYDAPCSHIDHVAVPPPDATVLAANAISAGAGGGDPYDGGRFWGVQYHPEYSLREIAAIIARRAAALAGEGLFASEAEALAYVADLRRLDAAPERRDLACRLGLGEDVLDPARRRDRTRQFPRRLGEAVQIGAGSSIAASPAPGHSRPNPPRGARTARARAASTSDPRA